MDNSPSKMNGLNPRSYQMDENSEIGISNKMLRNDSVKLIFFFPRGKAKHAGISLCTVLMVWTGINLPKQEP